MCIRSFPSCKLQTAVRFGLSHRLTAFPALSRLLWVHEPWAYTPVLSQSQELTGESQGVVMHYKQCSHISKLRF